MPRFAHRMARVTPSAIMELLKTAGSGEYISFAGGLPDPALFPSEQIAAITERILSTDGAGALQYGPAEGYPPLRECVAERLRGRGFRGAAPENVLITSGSQQALDLAARAFVNEGDAVCIESPTYLASLQVCDSYGARYLPVPQDDDGMVVDEAERALAAGCATLFALPNFQNPTGRTLSAARRERLAPALDRSGAVLIEDDAYYDLRYEGDPLPPIASLMARGTALYSGSFSKIIAPGLRVGYIHGPADIIARLTHLKQITDLHTGSLSQRVVYQFVATGALESQIDRLRAAYRAKRGAMLAALQSCMPSGVAWTRPAGGMFVWLTLPEGMDASAPLKAAMARGVIFVPGASFHPEGRGANTLRLNFVSASEAKIAEGIRLLADVIANQSYGNSRD
ncbi:MAG TPA: PLP-dependent aminotransferase family protein [Chthonomonadaceae bacterium]|nr:PLP-dependent aminotransferase family protein [Chthonomonadaceae bacterium]